MSTSPAQAASGPAAVAPTERPPAPADALLGQVLDGRYRIEAKIGEGGLGTVYRARHVKLERAVAIKVLKAELRAVPDIRQRFEREVRTLAALSHPNIVTITDYGDAASIPYLVMELVEGEELSKLVSEGISPVRALSVARQILASLAYAHRCDVVHRDLKPANVIVRAMPDGSDHAVVLDFGLAKFVGDDAAPGHDLTRSGLVVGTPAYLPPEQIGGGAKKADARSDLYAVGLILFEMLTGRRPFLTDDAAEMLRAHLSTRPPTLASASPGALVSPALEALVQKALEKTPADRFADARAMLKALDALGPRPMERASDPREPTGEAMSSVEIELDSVTTRGARSTRAPEKARPSWFSPIVAVGLAVAFGAGLGVARWAAPSAPSTATPSTATPSTEPSSSSPPTLAASPPTTPPAPPTAIPSAPVTAPDAGALDPALVELDVAEGEGDIVEDPTETAGLTVPATRPAARNPWLSRVPRPLARLRTSFQRGGLSNAELRALTRYRNEHAVDPRPRYLIGHAFASRGWFTAALDQYERAFSLDLASRGEPDVLSTMVRIARTEGLAARASNMIVTVYGSEAREAVERALSRERDDGARGRLQVLRARLE